MRVNGNEYNANSRIMVLAGILAMLSRCCAMHALAGDVVLPAPSRVDGSVLRKNWDALRARGLRLLPVPKKIEFTGEPVVLAGKGAREVVIVLAGESARGRIAVNEIVSRMRDFGSSINLPVETAVRPGAYNIIIENSWPNTFTRDPARPGDARVTDQAYGLYPKQDGIVLAGQGEVGMLYAAVTLRWLIRAGDGRVLLYPASVIDWPDYKHRQMGTLCLPYLNRHAYDPGKHLTEIRAYIDWLFRMKATMVFRHTIGAVKQSSLPDKVAGSDKALAAARIVNDYMRLRGIATMHNDSVLLGKYPKDKDRPGFSGMMVDKGRGHYHSWARHDLHGNKAKNLAEFCRRAGHALAFIHAVDSGGILDPEMWSHRDRLTREKYGNDRVQADADMFNIYADAMKKFGNGAEVVFVAYPYTADYLDDDFVREKMGMADTPEGRRWAREKVADMKAWMLGINRKLTPGVRMCIRESSRMNMFRFYSGYPGRPMWVYWEITHYRRSIYPVLSTNVRCIGSGYSPDRPQADILWVNDIDYGWLSEPVREAACEYAWNTRFPGSRDYVPAYMHGGEPEVDDQDALEILAERAAVGLWGAEAGRYMKQFLASHLSWRVAVDPGLAARRLSSKVLPPLIRKNSAAARKSCQAMDVLWEKVKAARAAGRKLMDDFSYPFFVQYYLMAKGAKVYADMHLRELQIMEAIRGGNMQVAVQQIIAARKELDADKSEWQATVAELEHEPMVMRYKDLKPGWIKAHYESAVLNPDFAALARRLARLEAERERLYAEYNVSAWFRTWFKGRALTARRTGTAIAIDGVMDEPAWRTAVPVDQFVGHRNFKLLSIPCEARLLYDKDNLYLGARMLQPLIGKIQEPRRMDESRYVFTEQVEFLFVPGKLDENDLYQFVVDTAGNLFAMRKEIKPKGGSEYVNGWPSGAGVAVSKSEKGWSFELAIPLAAIGRPARGKWHAAIARDVITSLQPRQVETYASSLFHGKSYHTRELYAPLWFAGKPRVARQYQPGIFITAPSMQTMTTARGQGSMVSFGVQVETRHPLVDLGLRVRLLGPAGNVLLRREVPANRTLIMKYATPKPLRIQLDNVYPGVRIRVDLDAKALDGSDVHASKTSLLGDVASLCQGESAFDTGLDGGRGVCAPIHFPVEVDGCKLLSLERGSVEFWFRPACDMRLPPEQWGERDHCALFHLGPVNRNRPYFQGRNSVAVWWQKKGWLSLVIFNERGDRRLIHSRLPDWRAGQWHHVAVGWDLNCGGKSYLVMFLDGRKIKSPQYGRQSGKEDFTPMLMRSGAYAAQLGSLNSGCLRFVACFDELRIRGRMEYEQDFVPARTAQAADGMLRFDFDSTLEGVYSADGETRSLKAVIGSQESKP